MEPFLQGPVCFPVVAFIPVGQCHGTEGPACEWADILQLSMAREVAWGRG